MSTASKVGIINAALNRLGANPISSISSAGVRGSALESIYNSVRDDRLAGYKWRFALAEIDLNRVPDTTEGASEKYEYHYQIPNNVLRPVGLISRKSYLIMGSILSTNDSDPLLVAVVEKTEGDFPEWFRIAMEYQLCAEFAPRETEDTARLQFWTQQAQRKWSAARVNDARTASTDSLDNAVTDYLDTEPVPRY